MPRRPCRLRPPRFENAANGGLRGVPPVFGTLLGPQRPLHPHVFVRRGERMQHLSLFIHQQRPAAAGADIDSEPEHELVL